METIWTRKAVSISLYSRFSSGLHSPQISSRVLRTCHRDAPIPIPDHPPVKDHSLSTYEGSFEFELSSYSCFLTWHSSLEKEMSISQKFMKILPIIVFGGSLSSSVSLSGWLYVYASNLTIYRASVRTLNLRASFDVDSSAFLAFRLHSLNFLFSNRSLAIVIGFLFFPFSVCF